MEVHTLTNARGMVVRLIPTGGTIVSIAAPDRNGLYADVALGYDSLEDYAAGTAYAGATIGRYANRIAKGRFTLDGREYRLATNDGPNHLHGGRRGFDKVTWRVEPFRSVSVAGAVLAYTSPDGEEGYPGTLQARVIVTLTDRNELVFDARATTDRPTVVNLTQHTYFDLSAGREDDILGHELTIPASRFIPVDASLVPTGELRSVDGTPFDFRRPTAIGARIGAPDEQLARAGGYDHSFVLDRTTAEELAPAARLFEPGSGRVLEILTTEPGLQLFSGQTLGGAPSGKGGRPFTPRCGLALETQHFPDSPNRPEFPSTVLRPGAEYASRTVWRFAAA
jgi:aldose 1-epimerase